jgi:Ca2+-binding RTX toxin-like protein
MASFVFSSLIPVNSADLDLADVGTYDFFSGNTMALNFFDNGNDFTLLSGSGFVFATFQGNLVDIIDGTLISLSTFVAGEPVITVTGWNVDAVELWDLIVAGDDRGVRNLLLEGNDIFTLSDRRDRVDAGKGNDLIFAQRGNDVLNGGRGDDTLAGGRGDDRLTGDLGRDAFLFAEKLNAGGVDTITDFGLADDMFLLDPTVFRGLGNAGQAINASRFALGAAADANDRLIYDIATGILSYDRDGDGAEEAVQFAKVTAGLTLTADHFLLLE